MSDEAIRIECPGCQARFRMRSRGNSGRTAVKCPKCGAKIPLPSSDPPARPRATREPNRESSVVTSAPLPQSGPLPPSPPKPRDSDRTHEDRPKASDEDLRKMLLRAKRKRSDESAENDRRNGAGAVHIIDRTIPDMVAAKSDDTDPDYGMDVTMPIGRNAMTARDLGTADVGRGDFGDDAAGGRVGAATIRRKRHDTPRAGARVPAPALRHPSPPAGIERPVVDEPTYTGPMPGRTPHITPSGSDLSRFLEPGNYFVRVEESVYDPVSEKDLVKLLNAGVFFAIDELCPEHGDWIPISSPELFSDLKGRLAHRAHHMLARVVPPRPASDYGRPPPEPVEPEPVSLGGLAQVAAVEPPADTGPSVIVDEEFVAAKPSSRKRLALLVIPLVAVLGLMFVGLLMLVVPGDGESFFASSEAVEEDEDPADLSVLGKQEGPTDPVPAFQSALAGVTSAHAFADSIDGMLRVANEDGDDLAATILAFEKWKRQPDSVEPRPLIQKLMARKQWQGARQVATWTAVSEGSSAELEEVIDQSLRSQFESETPVEITSDRFTRIVRVDPGHRPAFILADKHGELWTVWPDLGEGAWRNDIAVYRLCQLMVCHFRVAETREISITKDTFRALSDASNDDAKEMASKLSPDFSWSSKGTLRGSIRPLPTGAPWPIELSQIWRPWLTAGSGLSSLQDDVEEAHHQIAFFGAEKVYPEVHGMSARQLARQVSSILLVDYIVNNWNRFAPNEENWGSRTRIDDGLVYSVEDSAAFFKGDSVRVRGRFSWSKRFSRATVESLKNIDKDLAEQFLFPDANKAEREKLEDMWQQRSRALRRISQLVKEYGADDVYALDGAPK